MMLEPYVPPESPWKQMGNMIKKAAKIFGMLLLLFIGSIGALVALTISSFIVVMVGFYIKSKLLVLGGLSLTFFFSLGLYGLTSPIDFALQWFPRVREEVLHQFRPFAGIMSWAILCLGFVVKTRLWDWGELGVWIVSLFAFLVLGSLATGRMDFFQKAHENLLEKGWLLLAVSVSVLITTSTVLTLFPTLGGLVSAWGQRVQESVAAEVGRVRNDPPKPITYSTIKEYLALARYNKETGEALIVVGCPDTADGLLHLYHTYQNVKYDGQCPIQFPTQLLNDQLSQSILELLKKKEELTRPTPPPTPAPTPEATPEPTPTPEPTVAQEDVSDLEPFDAAPTPEPTPVVTPQAAYTWPHPTPQPRRPVRTWEPEYTEPPARPLPTPRPIPVTTVPPGTKVKIKLDESISLSETRHREVLSGNFSAHLEKELSNTRGVVVVPRNRAVKGVYEVSWTSREAYRVQLTLQAIYVDHRWHNIHTSNLEVTQRVTTEQKRYRNPASVGALLEGVFDKAIEGKKNKVQKGDRLEFTLREELPLY